MANPSRRSLTVVMAHAHSKADRDCSQVLYDQNGITVTLESRGLVAVVTLHESCSLSMDLNDLKLILESVRITEGVKEDQLALLVEQRPLEQPVVVAEGVAPVHGRDGYIEYHVNFEEEEAAQGAIRDDGSIDFKSLNLIKQVSKGGLLATKHPPTLGIAGRTVQGDVIPAQDGKPVKIPAGRNTRLSDDELQLFATHDGSVTRTNGQVVVTELYTVNGDVDFSTGNIDFKGSVLITGNVLTGFEVKAQDDIIVHGVVEGAKLSAGGNIFIQRGVQGVEKAEISAGGDITATFIQHATVEARGKIRLLGPLLHSKAVAGQSIVAEGNKGAICGGSASALVMVRGRTLGGDAYTRTIIEVGSNPALQRRLHQIQARIKEIEPQLNKAMTAISTLKKLQASGALRPEQTSMLGNVTRTQFALARELRELQNERSSIEHELQSVRDATIISEGVTYPGVHIIIQNRRMIIQHPLKAALFKRDLDGIATIPYLAT